MEERGYGSGQPQLDVETPGYEFRYRYNIPANLVNRVCTCDRINYVTMKVSWACGTCGKPPVHFLYKCKSCDEVFIRDFSWPWWCSLDPRCWNCIQEVTEACPKHGIVPIYKEKGAPLSLPLGLNPRKFTPEEMEGVFDFLDE